MDQIQQTIVQEKKNWSSPKINAIDSNFSPMKAEMMEPHPGKKMLRRNNTMCIGGLTATTAALQEPSPSPIVFDFFDLIIITVLDACLFNY